MQEKRKIDIPKKGKSQKRLDRETVGKAKRVNYLTGWLQPDRVGWIILIALSLIISILLFPNILRTPTVYKPGDIAEADIKASHEFLLENEELTEKDREKAVKEVRPVYDFDYPASNLISRVSEAFQFGRDIYLKSREEILFFPEEKPSQDEQKAVSDINRFFNTLEIKPDEIIFNDLMVLGFPKQVEDSVIQLVKAVLERGVVGNRKMLKSKMDKGGIVLHEIYSKKETAVSDFNRFYSPESAEQYIQGRSKHLKNNLDFPEAEKPVLALAKALVKPNLTFNQRETESRKSIARAAIKPIYFKIKKGEMIVREGERIGSEHLIKIYEQTRSQKRTEKLGSVPAMMILIGSLFLAMYLIGLKGSFPFKKDTKDLLFNSVTLLGVFIFVLAYNFVAEEIARGFPSFSGRALLFAMPVACGAMLISVFQGIGAALTFSLVISVLVSLITGGHVELFVYFFISSLFAAYGVTNCNERGILIRTGLLVGLVNIVASLSISVIYGSLYTFESLVAILAGFIGGVLSGVVTTGILPIVEMSFGFTTDIKLLELANLDQPLLRNLMVQAPGTYHHSVIVSNMVEAAARAVQANPLLAKVSAYYHDIGKMKKPLYFIENQRVGENRHEKLAPSMSSLILTSHVKDGVELARDQKLGRELIDIIQQHHGTSLISFFFHKAKERMASLGDKGVEIKEEDFRYSGPKPQTKEAGLVMLADMAEAASRSIIEPTPARIQGMVQKIVNKAFSDGQLDECELTLKDLHEIAKSFNQTLSGIFHHRVEYPDTAPKGQKKGKNGNSDNIPTEVAGNKGSGDKEETENGLKRLGLS